MRAYDNCNFKFSCITAGMETDNSYEQKLMPEGRLIIDGFLCCFDVSMVSIVTVFFLIKYFLFISYEILVALCSYKERNFMKLSRYQL